MICKPYGRTLTWTSSKLVNREPRDEGVFRVSAIMFSWDLKIHTSYVRASILEFTQKKIFFCFLNNS